MQTEIAILTGRGNLTLPASIRRALGLKGKQLLLVETTPEGEILLRPAAVVPIESYSEARIAEFAAEEKPLAKWLKGKKPRKK